MSSTDNSGVADCTATLFFFSNNAQKLPEKAGEICLLLGDRNMRKKTRGKEVRIPSPGESEESFL